MSSWTPEALRAFEDEIKIHYLEGKIYAPIHLSGGNEQQLIEVFRQVRLEDWVFATYRSHYHALLRGVPPERVKDEILAGHSIHLNFPQYRFFTSAIVGGCLPIALGVALGIKRRQSQEHVWVFVGDMAARTGIFHECQQYAANFQLPLSIVVEDNGLSVNTPTETAWGGPDPYGGIGRPGVQRYRYTRAVPHIGAGQWVTFA